MGVNLNRIRICIEQNGAIYKTASIYFLRDGSFCVDMPYCNHSEGVLTKYQIDHRNRESKLTSEKFTQTFSAASRVKLTIHRSGFVQFSGKGITSGIDKLGKTKGMGLNSFPLTQPIKTGPTVGFQVWGLEKGFQTISDISKTDFIYYQDNFIERPLIENEPLNTYLFEIWVLPWSHHQKSIVETEIGEMASLKFLIYHPRPLEGVFRVQKLKNIDSFIAILPFKATTISAHDEFGFVLNSPGEKLNSDKNTWHLMSAKYPKGIREYQSIDFPLEGAQSET